jgi:hypothetical protein
MANLLISKKADEELVNIKGFTPWQCIGVESTEVVEKNNFKGI